MVGPFTWCLSQSVKNICVKVGIQAHFRRDDAIKNLLVSPKERETFTQRSEVIYRYKCDMLMCEEGYIAKSGWTFWESLREHLRVPSPIYGHAYNSGHHTNFDNFSIEDRKHNTIARTIKEAMFIRVNDTFLNRKFSSINCPTNGMRSCSTPLTSISNRLSFSG